MKKTLALLIGIGFITMAGTCKDNTGSNSQTDTSNSQTSNPDQKPEEIASLCAEYSELETLEDQKQWIQNHLTVICDGSLSDCLVSRHSITVQVYNDMLKAFWEDDVAVITTKKWSDIQPYITSNNCQDRKYVGFTIKDKKVDEVVLYDNYSQYASCYSIALFAAIKKKYGLNNNDSFEFVLGKKLKTSSKIEVLFKVKGKYYDLTVDPMR